MHNAMLAVPCDLSHVVESIGDPLTPTAAVQKVV